MHAVQLPTLLLYRIAVWLVTVAWLFKFVEAVRGLRRVPDLLDPQFDIVPPGEPALTVIIPARNEQAAIAQCLSSLLAQDYTNLHILAIDDRSTDRTGAIMDSIASRDPGRITSLHIERLPPGWLGKTHAMALAARHAIAVYQPRYILFTDADVLFHPQILRRSLAFAVAQQADHFVAIPTPILKSFGEAILLGYLQVMGLWAARPWKVADPRAPRDAVGIGAFNLLRTSAYQQLGGFDRLRLQILEDLTLARSVKQAGLRQRIAFAPGMVTLHWASGLFGVVNVMTKNLFAVFRFRATLLLPASAALLFFCLLPVAALFRPSTRAPGLLALVAITGLYRLLSRFSRIPPWTALFFPISALLFLYSLLRSMFTTLRQGGVTWRGTFYPLAELRKNVAPLW